MVFRITRKGAIVASLLAIAGAAVVGAFLLSSARTGSGLTLEAARREVLSHYDGNIESATLQDDVYRIRLRSDTGLYELSVLANGGGITSIERLEANGGPGNPDGSGNPDSSGNPNGSGNTDTSGSNGNPDSSGVVPGTETPPVGKPGSNDQETGGSTGHEPAPSPDSPALLSKADASALALKKVKGTVQDIDLKRSGAKRFYLVEIDTSDGREAVIQINAASGAVMSVTWDDDDNDDDKDED